MNLTTTTTNPPSITPEKPTAQITQVVKSSAASSLNSTPTNYSSSNNNNNNNHADDDEYTIIQEQKGGTRHDGYNMNRMGKRQDLRRNFRFVSIVGFVMVLQSTWESVLLAAQYGLVNGGTAGLIWMTTGVIVGALCMIASLAEVASMAPTAGGQYHWVSEFAPKSWQKSLSYLLGWSCAMGWITGCPPIAQLTSTLVQGLVLLWHPDASVDALWQTTLFIMLFLVAATAFNIFCARQLPLTEAIFMVVHVLGFFVFVIVLWVTSEHAPAKQVFTQFEDNGGWGNTGLSVLVGITTPLWCFLGGPDASAHMSEELKDASRVLPSALMWGSVCNMALGLLMLITFCFCLGPDWQDNVLGLTTPTQTGIPIIQVLYQSTNSKAATTFMTFILILLSMVALITCIASTSRQVWAFARDKGFPFSSFLEYVRPGWDIPVNALVAVLIVSLLISALNFGSDVALNAIISLSNAALLFSYIATIGAVRLKRLRNEELLERQWSLGRWGALVNDVALAFLSLSFVLSFFPETPVPGPEGMNWAVVIFAFVLVAAAANYWVGGARKVYVAPVSLVKRQ